MTYVRPKGADLAERLADECYLSDLLMHGGTQREIDARTYIYKAVSDYSRARRSEDELRQHLQAFCLQASVAAEFLSGLRGINADLVQEAADIANRLQEQIAAVARVGKEDSNGG